MTDQIVGSLTGFSVGIPNWGSGPNISNLQLTINSPSGIANWNTPQTAIVSYYDPTVGKTVSETFLIGSTYGPSRLSIRTGSLSPGAYAGEIQVVVLDSSLIPGLAPGSKHLGPIPEFLYVYGIVNAATDGLRNSAAFTVEVSKTTVVPIDLYANYAPGYLTSLGIDPTKLPNELEAQFDTSGNFVGFWPADQCFLAGTPVTLANGTTKTIETIRAEDIVLSYNALGNLVPSRVTRVFVNDVAHVLDFHGTGVTPGHVFLCGAGRFAGRHVPLIDILRDDGAVVRQDGCLMRASTGCVAGSGSETIRKARCGVRFSPRMHAPSARSLTSLLNLTHVSCLERHKANEA